MSSCELAEGLAARAQLSGAPARGEELSASSRLHSTPFRASQVKFEDVAPGTQVAISGRFGQHCLSDTATTIQS